MFEYSPVLRVLLHTFPISCLACQQSQKSLVGKSSAGNRLQITLTVCTRLIAWFWRAWIRRQQNIILIIQVLLCSQPSESEPVVGPGRRTPGSPPLSQRHPLSQHWGHEPGAHRPPAQQTLHPSLHFLPDTITLWCECSKFISVFSLEYLARL